MKKMKQLFVLNLSLIMLILGCQKRPSSELVDLKGVKKIELSRVSAKNQKEFYSSVGYEKDMYYVMTIEQNEEAAIINRKVNEKDTINNTSCNFIGNFEVKEGNDEYLNIIIPEDNKYFFIPYNPKIKPVSIIKGGLGIKFSCNCKEIDLKKVGLCLINSVLTDNTASVKCESLQCVWCELKQEGWNELSTPCRVLNEYGLGTFIEADVIIVDGAEYTH